MAMTWVRQTILYSTRVQNLIQWSIPLRCRTTRGTIQGVVHHPILQIGSWRDSRSSSILLGERSAPVRVLASRNAPTAEGSKSSGITERERLLHTKYFL